jgi:hypothetical protein
VPTEVGNFSLIKLSALLLLEDDGDPYPLEESMHAYHLVLNPPLLMVTKPIKNAKIQVKGLLHQLKEKFPQGFSGIS